MTDNEKIAEWRGYVHVDQRIKQPFQDNGPSGWLDHLHGKDVSIAFDTDLALWHGEGGLLHEIGKRNRSDCFIDAIFDLCEYTDDRSDNDWNWYLLTATPKQLTAALVKVIDNPTNWRSKA